MFINRETELAWLDRLFNQTRPTRGQLALLYGRRRIGKTALVRHWAEQKGAPTTYWAAEREPAPLQRRKLFARMLEVPVAQAPTFDLWADLWQAWAAMVGAERRVLILDEIPYAAESDPAFLSALQHAWDQGLRDADLLLILTGSHVHTMESLLARGSPLFGRLTGQWHLQPLDFAALRTFFPRWSAAERVAAYAILGGVPAYLEWLDPTRSLSANLRQVILAPGSVFLAEPALLLYDELREPRVYHAILQAIGQGAHTLDDIANAALIGKTHLSSYLARLQELRLVERRLPVTIPPRLRRKSRKGRYHLADPFLHFYYRFIAPHRAELDHRPEAVASAVQQGLRAFVGGTAFEALCRTWLARRRDPDLAVEEVGSHWGRRVQVDVVGLHWKERRAVIGECKWTRSRVSRGLLSAFVQETVPALLRDWPEGGEGWQVRLCYFARAGFTSAARAWAAEHGVTLVDLAQVDRDLAEEHA